jgi:hypothetical protein
MKKHSPLRINIRWWAVALTKNEVSIVTKPLLAMNREPGKLLGQSLHIFNSAQDRYDFSNALIFAHLFKFRIELFCYWDYSFC